MSRTPDRTTIYDHQPAERLPCACCGKRTSTARVAPACTERIDGELSALTGYLTRLALAQIPVKGGGEKVRTSKTAPLPLRLDPLSMSAAGRDDTDVRDAFVPLMQVTTGEIQVVETAYVVDEQQVEHLATQGVDPNVARQLATTAVQREQTVTAVRRTPAVDAAGRRVLVPAGDQAGVLPLLVWARAWVSDWRAQFGLSELETPQPRLVGPARTPQLAVGAAWTRTPASRAVLSRWLGAVRDEARREIARDVLGLGNGAPLPADAEPDPYAREWAIRYGQAGESTTLATHVGWLRTWLPRAADDHPDIAAFAKSLSALTKACRYVLGDIDDKPWIGRCPVGYRAPNGQVVGRTLEDRETGDERVCGAGLWHEPYASVLECPRCRTTTDERGQLTLSGWIRRVWPVDWRRRYTIDEVDDIQRATLGHETDLRMPRCDDCGAMVAVHWREATEPGDVVQVAGRWMSRRMWRVGGTWCSARCGEAEQVAS